MERELSLEKLQGQKKELVKDFKGLLQKQTQKALELGVLELGDKLFENLGREELTIDEKEIVLDMGNIARNDRFLKDDGTVNDRVVLKSDGKLYRMKILVGRKIGGDIAFWAPVTKMEIPDEEYLIFAPEAIKKIDSKISTHTQQNELKRIVDVGNVTP